MAADIGFFTFNDLNRNIQETILEMVADTNDLLTIIQDVEATVKSHLRRKYDVTTVFAQRGENRNKEILSLMAKMVVYQAYCINPFRVIPQHVVEENNYAREILKGASLPSDNENCTVVFDLPLLQTSKEGGTLRVNEGKKYGSWY